MSSEGGAADSAGTPWAGRQFEQNGYSADDGSAPEKLIEAILRFRANELEATDVVEAVRGARLLVPLVAQLGDSEVGDHGLHIDKSAELAIVTVEGPDGRNVMPAFTSVEAMGRWNPAARPVPADAVRVALSAANEDTELVVLDPVSESEFVIRRPALWAIAQSKPWTPSYLDEEVLSAFLAAAAPEPSISTVLLDAGDPQARLAGPELIVQVDLQPGLDRAELDDVLARFQSRITANDIISDRVDSLRLRLGVAS
jgi:hypothetical protein